MRWKLIRNFMRPLAYMFVIGITVAGVWLGQHYWKPFVGMGEQAVANEQENSPPVDKPKTLELNAQARANLKLVAAPAKVETYWRTIHIPGVIEDRPGITDRGITAPLAGVITQVHAFEGDIIQPGEKLFSVRIVSEYLQQTQADLLKAIREVEIFNQEISRIQDLVDSGSLPGKRKLELDQQISRQHVKIETIRQDLISRGLVKAQVEQIEAGQFLTTIEVLAPKIDESQVNSGPTNGNSVADADFGSQFLEIQDLKVELGQQVQAGQSLAVLANHNSLYVKGHAFKKEASRLARAAEKNWNVGIEFSEDVAEDWSEINQEFQIRHLANTTDPNSRTFDFFIPLQNQSRVYKKGDRPFVIWRFRPGQRVNISVPVDKIENVLVLPAAAVVFEGPEAFTFQQNGDLFNRIPVEVVHRDRYNVIVANDGSITPGFYLAQNAAASLNRVLKAQAASGQQAGVHVHADGTVHASH